MALDVKALGTLARFKVRVGVTDTASDARFEGALWAATKLVENYCGRIFSYDGAVIDSVQGDGTTELVLTRPPVWSVASVVYDGDTVDADSYEVAGGHRDSGLLVFNGDVGNAFVGDAVASVSTWTTTLGAGIAHNAVVGHERNLYVVTYAGGYLTLGQNANAGAQQLPADIEEACYLAAMYVAEMFSESGKKFALDPESGLPVAVVALLRGHRFLAQA